jgi:hypothetical protein
MNRKFIDFDEVFEENKSEPVVAHIYGEDWELPASLPADLMLESIRLMKKKGKGADVSEAEMADILSRIVPEEIMAEWVKRGLTIDQYGITIKRLLTLYTGGEADEAGETPAPEEGAAETPTA